MRDYISGSRCLMQLLQESLDDPTAEPCGRCSVCQGLLPTELTTEPSPTTVAAVTEHLRGEVHLLEPRKMWPGGAFGSRGRIAATEMAEPGRTVAYADAPEWREAIAAAFDQDGPAGPDLTDACVRVLAGWRSSWVARPEVVVDLAAAGFDRLTGSVADHLAEVGRLQRASLAVSGGSRSAVVVREMSSAEEASFWRDALDASELSASVSGRVVLLVVDATSSLWPVTVAAALLRRVGAAAVLPFLVHRRP
jgi:ATP-dependent DNA helicase RecQ